MAIKGEAQVVLDGQSAGHFDMELREGEECEETAKKLKYPRWVIFIATSNVLEKFTYFGIKAIMPLYLRDTLRYEEDFSTTTFHVFVMVAHVATLIGAIMADNYAGKFKTIMWMSIVYVIGQILLTVSAIPNTLPQEAFSITALLLVALGYGCIKSVFFAFVADQFVSPQQSSQLETYYSVSYWAMSLGGVIASIVEPMLRKDVQCFGDTDCFPLAFGVMAILMVLAFVSFLLGTRWYKIAKPQGNVIGDAIKCIGYAIRKKWSLRRKQAKQDHWLDYAGDKYEKELIVDTKIFLKIIVLFIPLPIFWATYEQQATRMNGGFGEGTWSIKPDQMALLSYFFVLLLMPLFNTIVYPYFKRYNLLTALQKVSIGFICSVIAYTLAGIIELQLEQTYPKIPDPGMSQLDFYNTLPCDVSIKGPFINDTVIESTNRFKLGEYPTFIEAKEYHIIATQVLSSTDGKCGDWPISSTDWNGTISAGSNNAYSVLITMQNNEIILRRMNEPIPLEKSPDGGSRVGFIVSPDDDTVEGVTVAMVQNSEVKYTFSAVSESDQSIVQTEVQEVGSGTYQIKIPQAGRSEAYSDVNGTVRVDVGGCYVMAIARSIDGSVDGKNVWNFQVTSENTIHMLWLSPQFFFMAIAELLVQVTLIDFSSSQAPLKMRSVTQSMWQISIAIGNLLVVLVVEFVPFSKQSDEFFLYAGLIGASTILFIFFAVNYEYVVIEEESTDQKASIRAQAVEDNISVHSAMEEDPMNSSDMCH